MNKDKSYVDKEIEGFGGSICNSANKISDSASDNEIWVEDKSLKEARENLPENEKRIIDMCFYGNKHMTQKEIAKELGISQSQVSRLLKRALERIKESLDN